MVALTGVRIALVVGAPVIVIAHFLLEDADVIDAGVVCAHDAVVALLVRGAALIDDDVLTQVDFITFEARVLGAGVVVVAGDCGVKRACTRFVRAGVDRAWIPLVAFLVRFALPASIRAGGVTTSRGGILSGVIRVNDDGRWLLCHAAGRDNHTTGRGGEDQWQQEGDGRSSLVHDFLML